MFITLLTINFLIAFAVCAIIAFIFKSSINKILHRLVSEDIYSAWSKYILFAIYVVGISGGVRVWALEKYITADVAGAEVTKLTTERWVLEVYRTMIDTLQSVAWMLLLFFIFALIAYVIVRGLELRKQSRQQDSNALK